jgi:ABC-2 type transport system permease protein
MLVELLRQAKRRRTRVALGVMFGLPIVIGVILEAVGSPAPDGGTVQLVDIATGSGVNFALFATYIISQLLLVIVVALFAGDTVAIEAQWGSLRYLLIRPLARSRLLSVKLMAALLYGLLATLLVAVASLATGVALFGAGGLTTPLGSLLGPGASFRVFAIVAAYIATQLLFVAALAFLIGTYTDNPLGAVGGAVLIAILSAVLDAISSLGFVRYALPTHYASSWFGLLDSPQQTSDMVRGLVVQVPWTVIPILVAYRHFQRKDILS